MNAFFERSWGAFFAAFIGSILALVTIPVLSIAWQQTYEVYDRHNPPVEMKIATKEVGADNRLYLRFYVTRHDDCAFLKLQGYSGTNPIFMEPSTVHRLDGQDPISYPINTTVLSNTWVFYPLHGMHIKLQGYYECNGRVVRPILVNESLLQNEQD